MDSRTPRLDARAAQAAADLLNRRFYAECAARGIPVLGAGFAWRAAPPTVPPDAPPTTHPEASHA